MTNTRNTSETGSDGKCPTCGARIGADAAQGLCPRCLLEAVSAATEAGAESGGGPAAMPDIGKLRQAFPELEIESVIGVGGMGAVFRARQPHLDRRIALKVLSERLARNPAFAERFNREAKMLARLNHANIVTVHDFGQRDGFYYLLMEHVDGVNLRQAMRAGRFTPDQALSLVPRICEALQFAHGEGVLHRDIKPENILLDGRGRVKIADFGIAKLVGNLGDEASLTVSGAALGTPAYMAPEQIENPSGVDHRADIYSLGVVLYELLTGELPLGRFAAPSAKASLDPRVDAIVLRALAKERELRQQSADQVRTEVQGVVDTPAPANAASLRVDAASTLQAASIGASDFVLCHPRLPRMAQWITVYALVVLPVLWLLSLASLRLPSEPNAYVQFVEQTSNVVVVAGETLAMLVMLAGGWKLRALKVSGPRWIRAGIGLRWVMEAVALGSAIWILLLSKDASSDTPTWSLGESLLVAAGFGALVFEIAAWVWLTRHGHRLAGIFLAAAPDSSDAAAEVALTAPTLGVARRATLAAVLTGSSLALGLLGIVGCSVLGLILVRSMAGNGAAFGIGVGEVVLGLTGVVVVSLTGVVGAVAGGAGLSEIRNSGKRLGGACRCAFALLAWPMVVTELFVVGSAGWVAHRISFGFLLWCGAGLAGAWLAGELLIRSLWRWVRKVPRGERLGRLPGWARGIVAASVMATLATLIPIYVVWVSGGSEEPKRSAEAAAPPSTSSGADRTVGLP